MHMEFENIPRGHGIVRIKKHKLSLHLESERIWGTSMRGQARGNRSFNLAAPRKRTKKKKNTEENGVWTLMLFQRQKED
ncbi:hypothetical protein ACE6H2_006898 [Prunus campanulata]